MLWIIFTYVLMNQEAARGDRNINQPESEWVLEKSKAVTTFRTSYESVNAVNFTEKCAVVFCWWVVVEQSSNPTRSPAGLDQIGENDSRQGREFTLVGGAPHRMKFSLIWQAVTMDPHITNIHVIVVISLEKFEIHNLLMALHTDTCG